MADTFSQASVHFTNRAQTDGLDAPIRFAGDLRPGAPAGGAGPAAGAKFLAQLYGGAPGDPLQPLGLPLPFRDGPAAGYLSAAGDLVRYVPGAPGGSSVTLQIKAWVAELGPTYEAAVARGVGGTGESFPVTAPSGGGISPPLPPKGLMGFEIAALRG
jgi:hypothetical protein